MGQADSNQTIILCGLLPNRALHRAAQSVMRGLSWAHLDIVARVEGLQIKLLARFGGP